MIIKRLLGKAALLAKAAREGAAVVQAYGGRKVYLICDNGLLHHGEGLTTWLERHADQLELTYLPTYTAQRMSTLLF